MVSAYYKTSPQIWTLNEPFGAVMVAMNRMRLSRPREFSTRPVKHFRAVPSKVFIQREVVSALRGIEWQAVKHHQPFAEAN